MRPSAPKAAPLRVIVAYKLMRAAAALCGATVMFSFAARGRTDELVHLARAVREHATSAWAIAAADALVRTTTPRHVWIVVAALVLDGGVTFVEGWGLHRGWRWAPWLVVGLTGALVPFEVRALVHHPSSTRVALLAVNVAVALYLARHAHLTTRRRVPREHIVV